MTRNPTVHHDVSLSDVLWYRIGGRVRYLLDIRNQDDIAPAIEFIERNRPERVMVVGLGSNLLMPDDYFDGAVIRVAAEPGPPAFFQDGERIDVFGGALLSDLALGALNEGLVGLEWSGGLPGTVGAGVRGNVGAFGGEIEQRFHHAEIVHFDGRGCQTEVLDHGEMNFAYRESKVKHERNWIVATASFDLICADDANVAAAKEVHQRNIDYRLARHPMEYPNCGSVFKNIADEGNVNRILAVWPDIAEKVRVDWHGKVSMGYIIGRLDLAGKRVGAAEISTKHHNFIVNLGGAAASDVRTLIQTIQGRVDESFGFIPEIEIEIIE
ncbi:MAG TPA: UDP-N-acetylmuramate dehydrogenase [Nitrolancea sp.]|nr:UDP-N-acetylmuramate dehydrogenase [Nitrolancea sp.]